MTNETVNSVSTVDTYGSMSGWSGRSGTSTPPTPYSRPPSTSGLSRHSSRSSDCSRSHSRSPSRHRRISMQEPPPKPYYEELNELTNPHAPGLVTQHPGVVRPIPGQCMSKGIDKARHPTPGPFDPFHPGLGDHVYQSPMGQALSRDRIAQEAVRRQQESFRPMY